MKSLAQIIFGVFLISLASQARAVPFEKTGAPPELAPYVPWVLYGSEKQLCPASNEGFRGCVLPLSLKIEVSQTEGSFEATYEIRSEGPVAIPGQSGRWPIQVAATNSNGETKPLAVLNQGGPVVWLTVGRHTITGAFKWDSPPETLTLPLGPVINVTIEGREFGFPAIDEDFSRGTARLWLVDRLKASQPQASETVSEDRFLRVKLDRLVVDSQPMSVKTRIRLSVGGNAREEVIGGLLPNGLTPVRLDSTLPARLTGEGLRVQVVAGVHDIFIDAIQKDRSDTLGPVSPLYGPESWAFAAQPHLRQVEVSGA
ncbi:MAG: hypothetical protein LBE31_09055, partial [Deltaproteobacteria bacterium]|nr:hypothetical protein [Deltaproteobacteria bacterium]